MTQLMAILNVTPDSFSDGGKYFESPAAHAAIERFIEEGADIIDIGAESTRPGAMPLTAAQEWHRLEPLLQNLPNGAVYSLDTRHAENARKALDHGIGWINDVSGFAHSDMIAVVRNSDCRLVVMHSLSVPADKNIVLPESADVIQELLDFAHDRIAALEAAGITKTRIIFDPGIGFGKTSTQSRRILDEVEKLKILGVPLLIGHSRKSFLGEGDRDAATLAVSRELIAKHIDYLRVHDVVAHRTLLHG